MPEMKFYAPQGVHSITLSNGKLLVVNNGTVTADSKFANELDAAGFMPSYDDVPAGNKVRKLTCLYRMQEPGGSLLVDSLGNGPDLTLEGTLGSARTTNPGYLTPNGTDNYARSSDLNGVLARIMDLRNNDDSAIMFGFGLINAGNFNNPSNIMAIGGPLANFGFMFGANEQLSIQRRGVGDYYSPSIPVPEVKTTGIDTPIEMLFVMHSPNNFVYTLDIYLNGVFTASYPVDFNAAGSATEYPSAAPVGVTVMGSYLDPVNNFFNNGGTSVGVRNIFFRRAKHNAAEEARIAKDLFFFPGETPPSLK